jgi:hypothetical protein
VTPLTLPSGPRRGKEAKRGDGGDKAPHLHAGDLNDPDMKGRPGGRGGQSKEAVHPGGEEKGEGEEEDEESQ